MGKHVNKRLEVKTEFRELSSKEWGRILALPFPPAARGAICRLFLENGSGLYDLLSMSYSNQKQINQVFIKLGLPYRLRNYVISKERVEEIFWQKTRFFPFDDSAFRPASGFQPMRIRPWVMPRETKLCTVTSYKVPV